jgi:hypothetical protein
MFGHSKPYSGRHPGKLLLIGAIFWTALVSFFDYLAIETLVLQIRALDFPSVQGVVTASQVQEYHGRGTRYGAAIEFEYRVNNVKYTTVGYRFGVADGGASRRSQAEDVCARFPVGANVRVFYDPFNPARAILEPGVNGSILIWMMFLTPFNLVVPLLWCGVRTHWQMWRIKRDRIWNGIVSNQQEAAAAFPLPYSPLACSAAALAVSTFLLTFVIGVGFGGFDPWMPATIVGWLIAVTITAFVYIRSARRTISAGGRAESKS